jgi:hypothetical protein
MLVYWSCMLLGNLLISIAEGLHHLNLILIRLSRRLVRIAARRVQ